MKTNWKRINVCNNCLSKRIAVNIYGSYCKKCGNTGIQSVLMRYHISLFKVKKEYKQYLHYVNPFEKNRN